MVETGWSENVEIERCQIAVEGGGVKHRDVK